MLAFYLVHINNSRMPKFDIRFCQFHNILLYFKLEKYEEYCAGSIWFERVCSDKYREGYVEVTWTTRVDS